MIVIATYANLPETMFREKPSILLKKMIYENKGMDGFVHSVNNGNTGCQALHFMAIGEEYVRYENIILKMNELFSSAVDYLAGYKILVIYNSHGKVNAREIPLIIRKVTKGITGEFHSSMEDLVSDLNSDKLVNVEAAVKNSLNEKDERIFLKKVTESIRDHSLYLFGYELFKVTKNGVYLICPSFKDGKVSHRMERILNIKKEYDQMYARRILSINETERKVEPKEYRRMIVA